MGDSNASLNNGSNRLWVTICCMIAAIMQTIDTTIASVALPYMQGTFGSTSDQISWVITSYILFSAIVMTLTGTLENKLGRRNLFALSILGFTIASLLCGLSRSLTTMVISRSIQGIFGACIIPLSQTIILDAYPKEKQGQAMAFWGMGVMVGPILGPTLGGYLTDTYSWAWVFLVNLPVGIVAFFLTLNVLKKDDLNELAQNNHAQFDWMGFITCSVGLCCLQLILDRGQNLNWFASREIQMEVALTIMGFGICLYRTLMINNAFIPKSLFKDRQYSIGMGIIFVLGLVLQANVTIPGFLENLGGYPSFETGIIMAPRGIGSILAMMIVGRLVSTVDVRWLISFGFTCIFISFFKMSFFSLNISQWQFVWTGIVQGLGIGFIFVPLSVLTFSTLPAHTRSEATGLYSLVRNIGTSIGIAWASTLIARNTQKNHEILAQNIHPSQLTLLDSDIMTNPAIADGIVNQQASLLAYLDSFNESYAVVIIPLILLFFVKKVQNTSGPVVHGE
jgi:DHA2 family multidrug resistance protein